MADIPYCLPCALRESGNPENEDNNAGKRRRMVLGILTAKSRLSELVCVIFFCSFYTPLKMLLLCKVNDIC